MKKPVRDESSDHAIGYWVLRPIEDDSGARWTALWKPDVAGLKDPFPSFADIQEVRVFAAEVNIPLQRVKITGMKIFGLEIV